MLLLATSNSLFVPDMLNILPQDASVRSGNNSSGGGGGDGLGDLPAIKISNDFPNIWTDDNDVVRARSHFSGKQRQVWQLGMDAFEAGKWDVARNHFDDVLKWSDGKDGPSCHLLGRMKEYNFEAPASWQGFWQS